LAGSENPKKKLRFFLRDRGEGNMAGLCRKLAGSENPKKNLRFFLRDGRRGTGWGDLKTQKKN
jgi:hypothetical protein